MVDRERGVAMDIADLHSRALTHTRRIVAGIAPSQFGDPTPCEGWDVRELLNHVISGNEWAAALSAGATIPEVGDRFDGDRLGDDHVAAYDTTAAAAEAAFKRPGALEAPCAVSYGPVPGEVYAGHRFIDVLIHGWDLAKATGQDTTLDPELVRACAAVVEPQRELLAGSGMFGDGSVDAAATDPQAVLLSTLGRTP
jgi:uncharacterized protein (TIGR03086 family)